MAKKIRCPCNKNPACKLCHGMGFYDYQPGELGWLPIPCPTCSGKKLLPDGTRCFTCLGAGTVDPANPPSGGLWDDICKLLLGA